MPRIIHTSTLCVPSGIKPAQPLAQPRYEIGEWFVTIYYAPSDIDPDDPPRAEAIAHALPGSLGGRVPLFLNQHHPSIPQENSAGSSHAGTLDEMHATPPEYSHYHVELIGEQRDIGFERLGVLPALMRRLEMFDWERTPRPEAADTEHG